jgi:hypothetical protein
MMADPDIPARPAPYTGGVNQHYPGSADSSTRPVPFVTQAARGDARGWLRTIVNYLTGRTTTEVGARPLIKPAGSRSVLSSTDRVLQSGPSPEGITRVHTQKIGGSASSRGIGTFPPTGGWAYIPHLDLSRTAEAMAGKAIPPLRTIDDHATIPAVYAGNPQVSNQ